MAAMLIAPLAKDTRLFILLEMAQVVFCAENGCLAAPVRWMRRTFFEWVEVETYEPEPLCTMIHNTPHVRPCGRGAQERLVRARAHVPHF